MWLLVGVVVVIAFIIVQFRSFQSAGRRPEAPRHWRDSEYYDH